MVISRCCEIIFRLRGRYSLKDSRDEFLHFENPYQILIATILSAQTTDATVNKVTKSLFKKYTEINALAFADLSDVEQIIHSTGFYHAKARNIIATSKMVVENFNGVVPATMEELLQLPGVGRKTANIILHHAFDITVGIAVDTHVKRVAQRLGITSSKNPDIIERDLTNTYPKKVWGEINGLLILHGRKICTAKKPCCDICFLSDICLYNQKSR